MKRKGIAVIAIALVIIVAGLLFWKVKTKNEEKDTIKIGVIMPQTGSLSEPGKNILEGVELALMIYCNSCEDSTHRIQLIIEDSKSNSRDGVSAINKLIHQDKVKIIIGDMSSDIFLAGAPIAEKNRVVMISPGASNPLVRDAGDYIFRDYPSDEYDGKIMADYLYLRMNGKRAGLIYVNGDYGIGVINAFEKEYSKLGGTVAFKDSFLPGTTDFKSMVIKIKEANPDVVYVVGNPAENGHLIKQMGLYKVNVPITGNLAFENNDFLTVARGTFDSIIYSTAAYDTKSDLPEIQLFVNEYQKKYHKTPDMAAGLGYDVMNILIHCLQKNGYCVESVKDELYKVNGFVGVTGNTTFDKNGDVMKDIYIKRMSGEGEVIFIEAFNFSK